MLVSYDWFDLAREPRQIMTWLLYLLFCILSQNQKNLKWPRTIFFFHRKTDRPTFGLKEAPCRSWKIYNTLFFTFRISEQLTGGFKSEQHKSSIPDEVEFGDDYADEEIPANNRLSYLGLLDGLHIQQAGTDYGQDYEAGDDYADDYLIILK